MLFVDGIGVNKGCRDPGGLLLQIFDAHVEFAIARGDRVDAHLFIGMEIGATTVVNGGRVAAREDVAGVQEEHATWVFAPGLFEQGR